MPFPTLESGFPCFRTNRFLSHLKGDIGSEQGKGQWSRWTQQLNLEAGGKEISNLPEASLTVQGETLQVFRSPMGTPGKNSFSTLRLYPFLVSLSLMTG